MNPDDQLSRGRPVVDALRLALLTAAISVAVSACEPALETPAAGAQNVAATDVPPPAPPTPAPDQTAPTDGQYASAEYAVGENTDAYDDNDPAALTDFRGALDPYGAWVDDRTYGTVWVPASSAVGPDFAPYATAGHWAYDDDWVWVSDYPWGWAPFHYGRWVLIEGRGWSWIPGRVYRGAWVSWGIDDGYTYLGWAPLGPQFVWFGGYAVGFGVYVGPRWVYCPRGEVFSPALGGRIVTGPAAAPIAGRMHAYVPATPGVNGPPPERMGFAPSQIPHAGGATAQSVSRAQAFARPSTAQAIGARPPTRVELPASRPSVTGAAPAYSTARGVPNARPSPGGTGVQPRPAARMSPSPAAPGAQGPASPSAAVHPHGYSPGGGRTPPPTFHAAPPTGGGGHHR